MRYVTERDVVVVTVGVSVSVVVFPVVCATL